VNPPQAKIQPPVESGLSRRCLGGSLQFIGRIIKCLCLLRLCHRCASWPAPYLGAPPYRITTTTPLPTATHPPPTPTTNHSKIPHFPIQTPFSPSPYLSLKMRFPILPLTALFSSPPPPSSAPCPQPRQPPRAQGLQQIRDLLPRHPEQLYVATSTNDDVGFQLRSLRMNAGAPSLLRGLRRRLRSAAPWKWLFFEHYI
jgi:hypothetical protein